MSNNLYDLKVEMIEILKSHGGSNFFRELNAARIPFFFAAATENTSKDTEYYCEAITPSSMGLRLADDKFADFLDIRNKGFVAVPSADLTSEGVQALKMIDETREEGAFYGGAIEDFAKTNGIELVGNDELDDDDESSYPQNSRADSLIDSIVQYTIGDTRDKRRDDKLEILLSEAEVVDVKWDTDGGKKHVFGESFAEIDERHKNILKGDGSYMRAKEREAAAGLATEVPVPIDASDNTKKKRKKAK